VRRTGQTKSSGNYIIMRKEQLAEDREKASKAYDKQWYTRLIQELDWAEQAQSKTYSRNCYMEGERKV
jgi:hypothetical protein